MSFLLVLAAAVTLVIGLLNSGLGLIYVSIACSVLAGIVLAVAVLRSRPRAEVQTGGPAPLPDSVATPITASRAEEPTRADLDVAEADEGDETREVAAVGGDDDGSDDGFPIAEYDDLKVAEILPLLGELDPDELVVVREREQSGAARATVLSRIDKLAGDDDGAEAEAAPTRTARATTKASARKATSKKAPAKKASAKKASGTKKAASKAASKTSKATKTASKTSKSTAKASKSSGSTKKTSKASKKTAKAAKKR